jgi:hypothetical protein
MGILKRIWSAIFGHRVRVPQPPAQPEAPSSPPPAAAAPPTKPAPKAPPEVAPEAAPPAPEEAPPAEETTTAQGPALGDSGARPYLPTSGPAKPPIRHPVREKARRPKRVKRKTHPLGAPPKGGQVRMAARVTPVPPTGVKSPPKEHENDPAHKRARRIARGMLSDFKEYHAAEVRLAVENDSFEQVFADELTHLRERYEERVPPEVRDIYDYFLYAVELLKADMRGEE